MVKHSSPIPQDIKNKEVIVMDISAHKTKDLSSGGLYSFTAKELRQVGASQFKEGDIIKVSKYYIYIKYGPYDTPALCSYIEDSNFKGLDCTPGCGTPYYIDDFKSR